VLATACGPRAPALPATVGVVEQTPAPVPSLSPESTCNRGTAHLLGTLRQPVRITVWVTTGMPKLDALARRIDDLLTGYERLAPGKIEHRMVEPKTDDERKQAKDDGMQDATFGEGSKTGKDQALISKGFMGMAFKYGSEKEAIPIMSPDQGQGLEFWIANKIREIHARATNEFQKIGIVTGKDEIKLSDANLIPAQGRGQGPNIKGIMEQVLPFYKFEDVDLQGGDAEINKEIVGLIVTQAGKDFTERELRRIDQFLMLGKKSVAVFASAVNLKASDATMKAELSTRGLDKLLDGYGIEMKKDAVFDWARPALVRVMTQRGPFVVGHPATVLAQYDSRADDQTQFLDQSFAGFFRMDELVFPFPSTLVPHADKQPGVTLKVLVRTTPKSTAVTSDTVDMRISRELKPQGEFGQHAIAVSLEGKIKSAFVGREDSAIPAPAESKDKSRVLVVAASQFLDNPYARSGNAPPMPPQTMMSQMTGDEELQMISQPYAQQYLTSTILAFKNTLDWITSDEDLIACSALLTSK
jgi:ABC-type uncharacterized transport system involved in gliding motility auxiliary subunit